MYLNLNAIVFKKSTAIHPNISATLVAELFPSFSLCAQKKTQTLYILFKSLTLKEKND